MYKEFLIFDISSDNWKDVEEPKITTIIIKHILSDGSETLYGLTSNREAEKKFTHDDSVRRDDTNYCLHIFNEDKEDEIILKAFEILVKINPGLFITFNASWSIGFLANRIDNIPGLKEKLGCDFKYFSISTLIDDKGKVIPLPVHTQTHFFTGCIESDFADIIKIRDKSIKIRTLYNLYKHLIPNGKFLTEESERIKDDYEVINAIKDVEVIQEIFMKYGDKIIE